MKNIAACNLSEYKQKLRKIIDELNTGSSTLPLHTFIVNQIRLKLCVDLFTLHQEFPRYVSVLCYKGRKVDRILLRIETTDYVKPNEVVDAIDFSYPKFEIAKVTDGENKTIPKEQKPKIPEPAKIKPREGSESNKIQPGLLTSKHNYISRKSNGRRFFGKECMTKEYYIALTNKIFEDAKPYSEWLPKSYVIKLLLHTANLIPSLFENNGKRKYQLIRLVNTNYDKSIPVSVDYDRLFRRKGSSYNKLFSSIKDKDDKIVCYKRFVSKVTTPAVNGVCYLTPFGKFLWEKYQEYKARNSKEPKSKEKKATIEPICYNCKHWNNNQNTGDLKRIAADCRIVGCRMLTDGTCANFKVVEVNNVQA